MLPEELPEPDEPLEPNEPLPPKELPELPEPKEPPEPKELLPEPKEPPDPDELPNPLPIPEAEPNEPALVLETIPPPSRLALEYNCSIRGS